MKISIKIRGVFVFVVGVALGVWQIYIPIHAKELELDNVFTSSTLLFLAVFFPILGLGYAIGGEKFSNFLEKAIKFDPNNLSFKNISFLLLMAIPIFVLFVFIQSSLDYQGYR